MKKYLPILFCLLFTSIYSQNISEKELKTEVKEVTVFLKNTQITREKSVDVVSGKNSIKFVNLSPFIDAKSIQVKASGAITVLSVNHQQNYLEKRSKETTLLDLESKSESLRQKIELEQTYLDILNEEIAFLKENRMIGGKNDVVTVTNLKETATFYGAKLTTLKLKEIERNNTIAALNKEKFDIDSQIKTISGKKEYPFSEIVVTIDAKNATKVRFEFSYLVDNAGWFPSYDIRAKNVNEPIEMIYKANVKQDTKIDWKDVKLKLSTGNPTLSGVAPELKPYFLNFNIAPPTYSTVSNSVSGSVSDSQAALPGVSVNVKGTTVGTTTDFDGKYSLTIPNGAKELEFSSIGMKTQVVSIYNSIINVVMREDETMLNEVVVIGYGSTIRKKSMEKMERKMSISEIKEDASLEIPVDQIQKQTTVDFEIQLPYSIKSDNKSYAVDISSNQLPAEYQYYSVPKINKSAYLIANISDWEKYNLLEGEANIFFEETFVGKSLLDVRFAKDTLQISLGIDKNIQVEREKITDFKSKNFFGSKKEELRNWKISIKNNKNQAINMLVFDQVPVSTNEEIKVELMNISNAIQNSETGELKWLFKLNPKETKTFELKYAVKYPKNKNLIIE